MLTYCVARLGGNIVLGAFRDPAFCRNTQAISYAAPAATTAVATILIGIKARTYFRVSRQYGLGDTRLSKRSKAEGIVVLLLESGLAYFLFFLAQVITVIPSVKSALNADPNLRFATSVFSYQTSCIVGMYPTIIICLVHARRSVMDSSTLRSSEYHSSIRGRKTPIALGGFRSAPESSVPTSRDVESREEEVDLQVFKPRIADTGGVNLKSTFQHHHLMMRWNLAQVAVIAPALLAARANSHADTRSGSGRITPKVFILNMFDQEANVWYNIPEFDLLARNITVPGVPSSFPDAHCTRNGSICELVAGEAEINAAVTMSALVYSSIFDLTRTYFLVSGVAGVSPKLGTTGSVTLARFAVQVALQYEIDGREIPPGFGTGYIPQGSRAPDQFPSLLYGTEVFELNDNLRLLAYQFAQQAMLHDTAAAQLYRSQYASAPAFIPGAKPPSVVLCDTATSDNFWAGNLLAEAFENTTALFTNNTGTYCSTQQEDNAILEALLRGAVSKRVDFSRIIIMRTGSDFDRPFPGQSAYEGLFADQGGFEPALVNSYRAGVKIVQGIVDGWDSRFYQGIEASNYVGDILGSLGGQPSAVDRVSETRSYRSGKRIRDDRRALYNV
ncbi:hypothetical protein VNI00_010988 [Paramarasmius palmivorus]|uniref:Purine nucleoside permease n=1 Tax=Paramarasmius palmivorus TaxID=297713 RepID=A0AAW0CEH3_9AGAR